MAPVNFDALQILFQEEMSFTSLFIELAGYLYFPESAQWNVQNWYLQYFVWKINPWKLPMLLFVLNIEKLKENLKVNVEDNIRERESEQISDSRQWN